MTVSNKKIISWKVEGENVSLHDKVKNGLSQAQIVSSVRIVESRDMLSVTVTRMRREMRKKSKQMKNMSRKKSKQMENMSTPIQSI